MKIAITGCQNNLGKSLMECLSTKYDIIPLNDKLESYIENIDLKLIDCDVFINCAYKDNIQTILFEKVFNKWKYEKKTIINIITSAVIFGGPNQKYIENKKDLETKTFELRSMDKEVRVINVYPNTLENTKNAPNQKLNFSDVSKIIEFLIELPIDIEVFQIGVSKTKLKIENSLL